MLAAVKVSSIRTLSGSRALVVAVVVLAGGGIAAAAAIDAGEVGPQSGIQPNGRQLDPVGKLTKLGNAPAGGALTRRGGYLWTLSAGRGENDIRIVKVRGRRPEGPLCRGSSCPASPAG